MSPKAAPSIDLKLHTQDLLLVEDPAIARELGSLSALTTRAPPSPGQGAELEQLRLLEDPFQEEQGSGVEVGEGRRVHGLAGAPATQRGPAAKSARRPNPAPLAAAAGGQRVLRQARPLKATNKQPAHLTMSSNWRLGFQSRGRVPSPTCSPLLTAGQAGNYSYPARTALTAYYTSK